MSPYIVHVREVHIQKVRVIANSKEEAIRKVAEGEGETLENELEYSRDLDLETWTVEKEPFKKKGRRKSK